MKEILILFKNDPKHDKYNRQIFEFLNNQYQNLNNIGFKINPIIINNNNIDKYVRSGIGNLPSLIYEEEDIKSGSTAIINFLTKCCILKKSKQIKKTNKKFNFDDYASQCIQDGDSDDDNENPAHLEQMPDIHKRMDEMNKQKKNITKPKTFSKNISINEPIIKVKNKLILDQDEERIMQAYGFNSDGEDIEKEDDEDFDYSSD